MSEIETIMNTDGLSLPYSAEAEQSVLGSILLDSEVLSTVMEIIPSAEYFHLSNHKAIYQAMIDLFTVSRPVDFVTVLEQLRNTKGFEEGSIKTYLVQLADIVPSISRVGEYCNIVKEKYLVRRLILHPRGRNGLGG